MSEKSEKIEKAEKAEKSGKKLLPYLLLALLLVALAAGMFYLNNRTKNDTSDKPAATDTTTQNDNNGITLETSTTVNVDIPADQQ